MFDWMNKLMMLFASSVEQNASVLLAAFIGATISVVAREERSLMAALASFLSGVFAGWYLSQLAHAYVPIPKEPLAAVLAIMGRDLVRHIMRIGRENPMVLLDIGDRFRGGVTKEPKKTTKKKINDSIEEE